MYFNYHAKAKKLINQGKLINYEIVEKHKNISPALLLFFEDGLIMPIRQHKWQEYFDLIEKSKD
jgi:hypothetical protein